MEKRQRGQIIKRLVIEYFASLVVMAVCFIALVYALKTLCQSHVWYGNEFWYPLLHKIKENLTLYMAIICLAGGLLVTLVFTIRIWLYLREVVQVSEKMALHAEEPVRMRAPLKELQDEMNSVREQMLRNESLAKEAEQRKNDLIVYLAHDLKTPLTSVIGYLTLLRDEPQISPELRAKYTDIAYDKAQRLEQLINEFFEITRFNLTNMELNLTRVSLSRMLEQTASEFLPIMEEKNLRWELSIEKDIDIVCDPDKLERVFDNLIRNAIFYCYEDSAIKLTLSRAEEYAWIRVENCGKTIPKEKLERIFEQFYRLDEARSSATGGSGLGLAIAKEIVELHGGHIEAESEEESIRFFVWLPLRNL